MNAPTVTLRPAPEARRNNQWVGAIARPGFTQGFRVTEDSITEVPFAAAERTLARHGLTVSRWVQVGPGYRAVTA